MKRFVDIYFACLALLRAKSVVMKRVSTPPMSSPKIQDADKPQHNRRPLRARFLALLGLLLALLLLLPLSRRYFFRKPPPPASQGTRAAMRYYSERIQSDPSDVAAYLQLGRLDVDTDYYTDAIRQLTIARALGAKDQDTALLMGRSLTYLAHYNEARKELQTAVRLEPDNLEAAATLAQLEQADGNTDAAANALRAFAARHPALLTDSGPAIRDQAERLMFYCLQAGDEDTALRMAQNLIRLAPDQPDGYSIAGKLLLARHNPQQALGLLATAVRLAPKEAALLYQYGLALSQNGRKAEAEAQWRAAVACNPNTPDAYQQLVKLYAERKDYAREAFVLQKLALLQSSDPIVVGLAARACEQAGLKIETAYWRGVQARLTKNYATALTLAQQVSAQAGWHNRGLTLQAAIYRDMNRVNDYLAVMKQLTSAHTADAELTMAAAYGYADRLGDQQKMLQSALNKHPADPTQVHFQLAQVALQQGRRDSAEAELQQCVRLAPDNPLYHQELGKVYLERRGEGDRLDRAIEEYNQLSRLTPNEVVAYQQLGVAYGAKGDWTRAARNLEHALDLLPGDGATYQELGRVYAHLGDTAGSEQMFALYRKYVDYDLKRQTLLTRSRAARKDPEAQLAVAQFLEQSGDYSTAVAYYRLAQSLRPHDAALEAKVQRLQTMLGNGGNKASGSN